MSRPVISGAPVQGAHSIRNSIGAQAALWARDKIKRRGGGVLCAEMIGGCPNLELRVPYEDFDAMLQSWMHSHGRTKSKDKRRGPRPDYVSVVSLQAWAGRNGLKLMLHNYAGGLPDVDAMCLTNMGIRAMVEEYVKGHDVIVRDVVSVATGISRHESMGKMFRPGISIRNAARIMHVIGWEFYLEAADG